MRARRAYQRAYWTETICFESLQLRTLKNTSVRNRKTCRAHPRHLLPKLHKTGSKVFKTTLPRCQWLLQPQLVCNQKPFLVLFLVPA